MAAGCGIASASSSPAPAQNRNASAAQTQASVSRTGRSHKYEELLPEQFYEELKRAPIAYWGCGAMEEHGLQNPLGADPGVAYETCLRAVEISGGILFPMVPFGPAGIPGYSREELRSRTKDLYPPSLWTSRETCKRLYIELLESLADLGFVACAAFGGHWPCDSLLQEIHKELEGRVRQMKFWGGGTVSLLRDVLDEHQKKDPLSSGHGMMWETSIIMAVYPGSVDPRRALRIKENAMPSQLKNQPQEKLHYILSSNAQLGERLINTAAQRLASLARGMLK
jgi:creatinine amidohydrolase